MSNFIKQLSSRVTPLLLTTLQLSLMLTLMLTTLPSFAEQANKTNITSIKSFSNGQVSSAIDKISQEKVIQGIKQRIKLGDSDQAQNKSLGTTRNEVINQKQKTYKNTSGILSKRAAKPTNLNISNRSFSDGSFVIYEGFSQLIEDYDYDGFYQTFSVTFDADLVTYNPYAQAAVYAELYLSENGGPWQHYYTTDSFVIQGESTDDSFEVYSTLSQGFTANHYDVLIDLYEVGYSNIVASYSSDDSNSLYALPLESSDYDIAYYEEAQLHGGSASFAGLMVILMVLFIRQYNLKPRLSLLMTKTSDK